MDNIILIVAVAISAVLVYSFVSSTFKAKKRGPESLLDSSRKFFHRKMERADLIDELELVGSLNEMADELGLERDSMEDELKKVRSLCA